MKKLKVVISIIVVAVLAVVIFGVNKVHNIIKYEEKWNSFENETNCAYVNDEKQMKIFHTYDKDAQRRIPVFEYLDENGETKRMKMQCFFKSAPIYVIFSDEDGTKIEGDLKFVGDEMIVKFDDRNYELFYPFEKSEKIEFSLQETK